MVSKQWQHRQQFGSRLGLERIERLCAYLDHPERAVPMVHVAGTNGKGSTAAFLSSILARSGYRVGLFTSPHLMDYSERFQINGKSISAEELREFYDQAEAASVRVEAEYADLGPVTEFEVATALGFLYFARASVDIAIIETGLGGRFDATNVVDPLASIITPIGFDHMDWLGDTIAAIAGEKAGIIKHNRPVIVGLQEPEAMTVLEQTARERHSPIHSLATSPWQGGPWDIHGGWVSFPRWGEDFLFVPLLGKHQLENAALALLAAEVLADMGWSITTASVQEGLAKTIWPGRLELVITSQRSFLLDGAHNRPGLEVLADNLRQLGGPEARYDFVVSMLSNKAPDLLEPLFAIADTFIVTKPQSSRIPPHDPETLARELRRFGCTAFSCESATVAWRLATEAKRNSNPVVVCGSLYLLGEIKALYRGLTH